MVFYSSSYSLYTHMYPSNISDLVLYCFYLVYILFVSSARKLAMISLYLSNSFLFGVLHFYI